MYILYSIYIQYIIYIYVCVCYHENNVPSQLSPQWLCSNSCTWAHDVPLYIYIYIYIYIYEKYRRSNAYMMVLFFSKNLSIVSLKKSELTFPAHFSTYFLTFQDILQAFSFQKIQFT